MSCSEHRGAGRQVRRAPASSALHCILAPYSCWSYAQMTVYVVQSCTPVSAVCMVTGLPEDAGDVNN